MDAMQVLLERRSIRKFTTETIAEPLINKLLEAAMFAPSSMNKQPWHFIVVRERAFLDQIPSLHPHAKMIYKAPLVIIICGDSTIEPIEAYNAINCAAATQNLLLAAYALELGGVWLGVYPNAERLENIRKLFSLPDTIIPVSMVAIGYPDEKKEQPHRFFPERIHWEKW
ncbi:MAG: nitroreductase family protein [Lentimicrobiaceae bacterium]|nr:nitroreductase family protein [Lentimicrobiaceae bacterium]